MAESNKNQTAAERARLRDVLGAQLSTHVCSSPECPNPGEPIVMRDLYSVVAMAPKKRTLFYHKTCGPKIG